jgi:hypothetical protein
MVLSAELVISSLHTSAYVSIRQQTSADVSMLLMVLSAELVISSRSAALYICMSSIRQHTSAYVSIRQHAACGAVG